MSVRQMSLGLWILFEKPAQKTRWKRKSFAGSGKLGYKKLTPESCLNKNPLFLSPLKWVESPITQEIFQTQIPPWQAIKIGPFLGAGFESVLTLASLAKKKVEIQRTSCQKSQMFYLKNAGRFLSCFLTQSYSEKHTFIHLKMLTLFSWAFNLM